MLELRDVWYWYEGAAEPAVAGVSLVVRPGERVVVLGRNGSGKSTLARLACGGLVPAQGEVVSDGYVGYVRQDPRDQLVSEGVLDEVAFGPCNLGWPRDEVGRGVRGALAGSEHLMGRMTHELSGGEQQLVAVAGVRAMRPSCYVLDEAGAHLDVAGRQALADAVAADVAGAGGPVGGDVVGAGPARGADGAGAGGPVGVIEVTQDLGAVRGASAVVVMERGRVVFQGSAEEFLASGEARRAAGVCDGEGTRRDQLRPRDGASEHVLACEGVAVWRGEREVLRGVDLELPAGLTLVVGVPGSGKTTLAQVLAGVLAPDAGTVALDGAPVRAGQVGLAFQRPEDQLWAATVLDDIAYGPRAQGWPESEALAAARAAAARLGVGEELLARSPFELSGGQMRRVALAGVVAARPGAYVFDEPTAGLDGEARATMHDLVADLVAEGAPVVVCTHDADEWRAEARAVVRLAGGVAEVVGAGAASAAGAGVGEKVSAAGAGASSGPSSPARARRRPPAPGAYVRGTTLVHRLDARVKLVALLVATVATFAASAPWGLVAAAAGLAVALAASRTSPATVLRGLRPAALVLAFALVANSLVLVGGVGFSAAGLARTGAAVARVVLVVGWVLVCSSTTMPPALAEAVADLMRPLGRLGVPVGDVSMVVSVTLRFVPIAGEEVERIRAAQAARGARLDEGGTIARLRGWTQVLVPLLVALFRRADVLAQAMVDRCYTGQGRTRMQGPLAPRDWAVLALVLAWALAVALL